MGIERGSATSHSVDNSLYKRPWSCHKRDYGMNEYFFQIFTVKQCELNITLHLAKS